MRDFDGTSLFVRLMADASLGISFRTFFFCALVGDIDTEVVHDVNDPC